MINACLQLGLPVTRLRGVPWLIAGIVGAGEFFVTVLDCTAREALSPTAPSTTPTPQLACSHGVALFCPALPRLAPSCASTSHNTNGKIAMSGV